MTLKFYNRTVNSLGSFKPVINKHAVLQYCMSVNVSAVWQGRTPDFGGSGSAGILRLAAPALQVSSVWRLRLPSIARSWRFRLPGILRLWRFRHSNLDRMKIIYLKNLHFKHCTPYVYVETFQFS